MCEGVGGAPSRAPDVGGRLRQGRGAEGGPTARTWCAKRPENVKEISMNIDNTIFGEVEDLNARRDRFRILLKASFKNERLLWLTEEEYIEILLGHV